MKTKNLTLLEAQLGEETVARIFSESKSLTDALIALQKEYNENSDLNSLSLKTPTCGHCCCVPGKFLPD